MFFKMYGAIFFIIFLGTRKSRTNFFKNKAIVPKKNLAHSFSYYPLGQTWSILLLGSTRYLGKYGACYKIFSLGPKRFFKTHFFSNKANFSVKKCFCPIKSRIVECDKPQDSIYEGHKDILTFTREILRSFFKT